jgi:hypothetical protein
MISRRPLPRYVIISGAHRPLFVDDHKLCPTEPDPKRTAPARPPGVPQGPAISGCTRFGTSNSPSEFLL